jgi:hypothetical protein
MSNIQKGIAAAVVAVLAIVLIVVWLTRHHGPTETAQVGTASIVMPDKISAADHEAYIASAIPACKTEAAKQPSIIAQHVADGAIADYCKCFAETSADAITQDELTAIANKTMPPSFMTKVQDIAKTCIAQYLPPAPAQ